MSRSPREPAMASGVISRSSLRFAACVSGHASILPTTSTSSQKMYWLPVGCSHKYSFTPLTSIAFKVGCSRKHHQRMLADCSATIVRVLASVDVARTLCPDPDTDSGPRIYFWNFFLPGLQTIQSPVIYGDEPAAGYLRR